MPDQFFYAIQIAFSVILLYYGRNAFKMAGGYTTTYGRFTYHILIIATCFTLISVTGMIRYMMPGITPLLNSVEVVYSLLLSYSFLIAGLELYSSQKKTMTRDQNTGSSNTFKGHMKGVIPRQIRI